MSSARNNNRPNGEPADQQADRPVRRMFGDDVEPLKGKGRSLCTQDLPKLPPVL